MPQEARGFVVVNVDECKGCALCIDSCLPKVLELAPDLSANGVHPAKYIGERCTGCGICYFCCPEPGAIEVYRKIAPAKTAATVLPAEGKSNAATV